MPTQRLTSKKEAFAKEYVAGKNAINAYLTAYPGTAMSRKAAGVASTLLKKEPLVESLIESLKKQINDEVVKRVAYTMVDVIDKLVDIIEDEAEKTSDKIKCLELVGKHLGGFEGVVNNTGNMPKVFFFRPDSGKVNVDMDVQLMSAIENHFKEFENE